MTILFNTFVRIGKMLIFNKKIPKASEKKDPQPDFFLPAFGRWKKDPQSDLRRLEPPRIVPSLVSRIFDLQGGGKPEKSFKGGAKEG